MTNPYNPHRLDPPWKRELRHMAALGGWVSIDYFRRDEFRSIGDHLRNAGYITTGERDNRGVYELTAAGWAWCRENGAA